MGGTLSHFYFMRSLLHSVFNFWNSLVSIDYPPNCTLKLLARQHNLSTNEVAHMYRQFAIMTEDSKNGTLTQELLTSKGTNMRDNPLQAYVARVLFSNREEITFPEFVARTIPFIDDNFEGRRHLDSNPCSYGRLVKHRALFRLIDVKAQGYVTRWDMMLLIMHLLKTTIPNGTKSIVPVKIVSEIARATILRVHENNAVLCRQICKNIDCKEELNSDCHELIITEEMFVRELARDL